MRESGRNARGRDSGEPVVYSSEVIDVHAANAAEAKKSASAKNKKKENKTSTEKVKKQAQANKAKKASDSDSDYLYESYVIEGEDCDDDDDSVPELYTDEIGNDDEIVHNEEDSDEDSETMSALIEMKCDSDSEDETNLSQRVEKTLGRAQYIRKTVFFFNVNDELKFKRLGNDLWVCDFGAILQNCPPGFFFFFLEESWPARVSRKKFVAPDGTIYFLLAYLQKDHLFCSAGNKTT